MTQEEFFKRFTYSVSRDRIGGGGFGTVYKAKDNVLHRTVAIKVSEVKTTSDGKKTFSLKDEFEALNHVPKHPNIANYEEFYSFESPQGIFDYAVMQYYPDGNLSQAIKKGLTDAQKEEIATQLLEGIDFLHKHQVVHRDLKPGNILIVRDGDNLIPLITDFGLSKAADTGEGSQFSNSLGGGTPRYSSPEQLQGKPLRFNTDLWSYGAIVYELFTGEQLFSPGSGAANSAQAELEIYNKIIHGDVQNLAKMPERWRKVAEECMVVDPEKRVKSAEELLFLLNGYVEITTVPGFVTNKVTPESTKTTDGGGKKSHRGLWIGLGAVVVAAVAVVVALQWPRNPYKKIDRLLNKSQRIFDNYCLKETMTDYSNNIIHLVEGVEINWKADSILEDMDCQMEGWYDRQESLFNLRMSYYDNLGSIIVKELENLSPDSDTVAVIRRLRQLEGCDYLMSSGWSEEAIEKEIKWRSSNVLEFTVNDVSFMMKRVEGGTFQMGAQKTNSSEQNYDSYANDNESPVHSVTINTFFMGETEVTQALWKAVMGNNPSRFQGDNLPVDKVSWNDCQEFILKLNEKTGKSFRLPMEAEWEYAARGGTSTSLYIGENIIINGEYNSPNLDNLGWYGGNCGRNYTSEAGCDVANGYDISGWSEKQYDDTTGGTHPVGKVLPNAYGLYDMLGNVWEWCEDRYGSDYYKSSPLSNPEGPSNGSDRVLRGGSWFSISRYCRVSHRNRREPDYHGYFYGFRLVLVP